MFSEKFDALMNIAEVSNSLLGRDVNMNPSYIGRLRSGARPLPQKHAYLISMCRYLAGHFKKDYQLDALQKLTGIDDLTLSSTEATAAFLEAWLLETGQGRVETFQKFNGHSGNTLQNPNGPSDNTSRKMGEKATGPAGEKDAVRTTEVYGCEILKPLQGSSLCFYGNAGKREAVEQFFNMVLQEGKTQTLLLYSDENMEWLYEDAEFAARWTRLFSQVVLKGNRVKIVHTISRNMNEMLEAVTKWIPIYMTGMIEPYCYPRIRDGVFQKTMFIAPDTAVILSSSVQQNTEGMLNLLLTESQALNALTLEFNNYFSLCRPLMNIYAPEDSEEIWHIAKDLIEATADAYFCLPMPPLFAMPEEDVCALAQEKNCRGMLDQWEESLTVFRTIIESQHLTLALLDPKYMLCHPDALYPTMGKVFSNQRLTYSKDRYERHIEHLLLLEKQYPNLRVCFVREPAADTILYIKEDTGAIMVNANHASRAFVISERTMVSAFWDYMEKCVLLL